MAKTGHVVGLDPMTGSIVILRKGMDGKAARQVDVLSITEAEQLGVHLRNAILAHAGEWPQHLVPTVNAAPEPEQAMLDLDSLTREDGN